MKREGYDNIENLANANALDIALRTGFSYPQLVQWISQARLHGHLRNDYHAFVNCTGIDSLDDFVHFYRTVKLQNGAADPIELIIISLKNEKHDLENKIRILRYLADPCDLTTDTPRPTRDENSASDQETISHKS